MCTLFPLFQLLHFLSLHPSLPAVIPLPPLIWDHFSGDTMLPPIHVVRVSQKNTHSHTSAWNYRWHIQGFPIPWQDTPKKGGLRLSNMKQKKKQKKNKRLRRAHQTGRHLEFCGQDWLRMRHYVRSEQVKKSPSVILGASKIVSIQNHA